MRGGRAWIVAIAAGIALVIVVTAAIGTGEDRGETVTAGRMGAEHVRRRGRLARCDGGHRRGAPYPERVPCRR